MAQGAHKITAEFERRLCEYTGAPYAIAIDNCSNALFLALTYYGIEGKEILIPKHTYPSVPCEIIHAGGKVKFYNSPEILVGSYRLSPTTVYDSALEFSKEMYKPGSFMCLSFTGAFKHLKLGKGGAILTDDPNAAKWLKRARFSGRHECSYLEDEFDMLGWNFYMMPEIAAKGILLMDQFYNESGAIHTEPKSHRYPDLSKWPIYQNN